MVPLEENDGPAPTRMRLLIVEDNPTDVLLLEEALSRNDQMSIQFDRAASLGEALAFLETVRYDVGLVDLGLPDSDGMETLSRILAAAPDLPVIVLTGQDDRETAVLSIQSGAQDFLVKGRFDPFSLGQSIRYGIERNAVKKKLAWISDAVEKAANAVVITDPEGEIQWVNSAYTRLTGYAPSEAIGRRNYVLEMESNSPELFDDMRARLRKGQIWNGELENKHRDGRKFYEELTITPILDERKELVHLLWMKQDISRRKQAELENEKRRRLLDRRLEMETVLARISSRFVGRQDLTDSLRDSLRDLSQFLKADAGSMFLFDDGARGLRKLAAWTDTTKGSDQIISPVIHSLVTFPELFELIAKGVSVYYGDIAGGESPGPGLRFIQETGIRALLVFPMVRDGKTEGLLGLAAWEPQLNYQGGDDRIMEVLVNLVFRALEFRESNTMLRDAFEFRDQIINSTSSAVLVLDRNGLIHFANRPVKHITGLAPEDVRGMLLSQLGRGELPERCRQAIDRSLYHRNRETLEGEISRPDGSAVMCRINLTPLSGAAPHRALVAVVEDITETHLMELQIQQAGKMATLGEMAMGIAHELNQPLSVISMTAQLLQLSVKNADYDPEFLEDQAGRLRANVNRATAIINHLRVFGRKADKVLAVLDLNAPLRESLELIGAQIRQYSIQLKTELYDGPLEVLADHINLEQVFINILRNGIDALNEFLPEHAEKIIEIRSEWNPEDRQIAVSFANNGPPIPEEQLPKIFEPFFTTKQYGQGTGLGLSICYSIIQRHHGSVEVRNTDPGVVFVVRLPGVQHPVQRLSERDRTPKENSVY